MSTDTPPFTLSVVSGTSQPASYLLLIDSALTDIPAIVSSLTPETDYLIFDFNQTTAVDLISAITKPYTSVGVAQHNRGPSHYHMVFQMNPGVLHNVSAVDSAIQTWADLADFLLYLRDVIHITSFDFLACDLWADENWRYVISKLESSTGIQIRASVNATGKEGDFILESDGTDTIGIYFTPAIVEYKETFYYFPTSSSAPHTAWNPPIHLPGNGGRVSMTNYVSLVGTMIGCSAGGATYVPPNGGNDIPNAVFMTSNHVYNTSLSYAVLTASGQVLTFGADKYGGSSTTVAASLTSGVVKLVASNQAFAALKVDGTIVSWGYANVLPITTTGNATIVPTGNVNLTGCIDVVSSGGSFAAVKANGSVVVWGYMGEWTLPTASDLSGVVQIKETYGYPSFSYIALRSDGHAVAWGPGGTATTFSLTSTSRIVDIYPTDYGMFIVRADRTIYKGFTNTISYTYSAGRSIVRVVPIYSSYDVAIMFDDNSMFLSSTSTLITGVSSMVVADNAFGYIRNGAVVCSGDARFGGSATDVNNGIKSGISVSSGVIRLACTAMSMAALKSDGSVAVWGAGAGGWPYVGGLQTQLTNVVHLVGLYNGYIAITADNRMFSWGDSNKWTGTPTSSFANLLNLTAGNTVSLLPSLTSTLFVDMPKTVSVSPNLITQYVSTTLTYSTNVQYHMAVAGRRYALYYGTSQISTTFVPSSDTYTYTFTNVVFPASGVVVCSLVDLTDVVYTMDSTVGLYVIPSNSIPPANPPTISYAYAGNSSLTVALNPPAVLAGALPILNYKYSLDDGTTFQPLPTQTFPSSVSLGALSTAISSGGNATMTCVCVHTNGSRLFVSDTTSKLLTSTFNGSSWSALATVSAGFSLPTNTYAMDMNADCTRGIAASINAGSKCFYFTNTWAAPIQIQDNVSGRTYAGLAMSADGNTIAAIADGLYYTTWNDASQNYGVFSLVNTDSPGGYVVGLSPDGKIVAYRIGSSAYYAVWNGSGYTNGFLISALPNTPFEFRFSQDGNMLFASCATTTVYVSVWNGNRYSAFTLLSASVTTNTYNAWGIGADMSNNLYVAAYGSSSIFKLTTTTTTTTSAVPSVFKLTSGLTNGQSYTPQFKSTNSGGDSTAVVASSSMTVYTLPGAPTLGTITPGIGQLTFTYSPGEANGSPITNYYYSINNGNTYLSTGNTSGSYTITGLTNGTTYYLRVKSRNAAGLSNDYAVDASGTMVSSVPGAPTINSCTAGIGQITVAFTAPGSNGGSAITGYYYTTASGGTYTLANTTTSPIIITGLANGATYYVRLMAVNIAGNSAPTAATTVVLSTSVPAQPVISNIVSANTQLTVSFTAPNNGGSAITNYFYSKDSGSTYTSNGNTNTTFTITGLTNGTSYGIMLKAVNAVGNSAASAVSVAVPCVPPDAPTINSVSFGNQQLSVAFSAPAFNGAGTITAYKYSVNGGSSYTSVGTTSPFVISGLTNGTAYTVLLKATNNAGDSAATTASEAVVPSAPPSAPTVGSVIPGNQTLNVAYSAPASTNGSAITNYWYSYDGTNYVSLDRTTATETFDISGLTNGTAYTIRMKATNIAGNSSVSAASASAVPRTVPDAPSISPRVLGNAQVSFIYSLPYNGGNAIDDIQYRIDGGDYTSIDPETTDTLTGVEGIMYSVYTLTGLTNGTTYAVQIRAHNAAGYSDDSTAINLVPRRAPDPPLIKNVTSVNGNINVRFEPPAYNGGNTITGYSYRVNNGSYTTATYPSFQIGSVISGTTYSVNVYAVNAAGTSAASNTQAVVPIIVPDKPTVVEVDVFPGSALLSFTDGSNNGPDILGYKYVITNTATNASSTFYARETTSPISIPNLTNGTTYSFSLIAYNCGGDSAPSTETITGTPFAPPEPPVIQSVVAGDSTASVYVVDGSDNGSAIQGYTYSLDGIHYTTSTSTESPVAVVGLSNDTYYTVCVKSYNSAGESAIPSNLSAVFKPYTVPDPPTIVSLTTGDQSAKATLTYTNLNGSTILGYKWSMDGIDWTTVLTTGKTVTMTGLTNGQSYVGYIKFVSNAGDSNPAATEQFIPANVPDAPTITSVDVGDRQLFIYFTDGSSNGSAITGDKFSLNNQTFRFAGQESSPIVVFPVQNAVSYSARILAINSAGESPPSESSSSVIPASVPFAPIVREIIPGDKCAYVRLERINANGSPITGLKYSFGGESFDVSGIQLADFNVPFNDPSGITVPFTIPNMFNKIPYNVFIYARNAWGLSGASAKKTVTPGLPFAATITNVVVMNTALQIYFDPPTITNGAPITKYAWGNQGIPTYVNATGTTSPLIIPKLVNGTVYRPVLVAINANGQSNPSNCLGAVIPIGVPIKMVAPTLVAGLNTATISYIAPNNNGATITGYRYLLTSNNQWQDVSGLSSPFSVPAPNNVSYMVKMIAINEAGQSLESPPSKAMTFVYIPPAQPKITVLTASFESIVVGFVAPASNGFPILTYKYAINTDTVFTDASTTILPIVITGLQNNTDYNVRVIATNAAGDSVPSAPMTKTVRYIYLPPLAGPVLTTITAGNQSAVVAFTAPAIRTAPITTYYYTLDGGTTLVNLNTTTSPVTITGLTNDVSYNISLVAGTSVGNSPVSAPKAIMPYYKPPAVGPVITTITGGNANAVVVFTAPATRLAPITTYYYSTNGGTTLIDLNTTTSPVTISGLTNDVSYNISLVAGTPAGNSPASLPKLVVPIYKAPGIPVIKTITPWNESAIVDFTAPAINGAPIIKYQYTYDPSGLVVYDMSGLMTPITITGLTNDMSYNISMFAVNSAGTSLISKSVFTRPIYRVPTAPIVGSISTTATSANITFTASIPNGATITTYKYSLDGGETYIDLNRVPKPPLLITGLTTKTTYSILLKSVNEVGESLPSVAKSFTTK